MNTQDQVGAQWNGIVSHSWRSGAQITVSCYYFQSDNTLLHGCLQARSLMQVPQLEQALDRERSMLQTIRRDDASNRPSVVETVSNQEVALRMPDY